MRTSQGPHNPLLVSIVFVVCLALSLSLSLSLSFIIFLNFLLSERRTSFWTWTILIIASYGFKHSLSVSSKVINTVCINSFRCTRRIEIFHVILWLDSLKGRHDHIFKTSRLVLTRFKLANILIWFPSRMQTSWQCLTDTERLKLSSINSDNGLEPCCRIPNKSIVRNSFPCKYYRWCANQVLMCFLQ